MKRVSLILGVLLVVSMSVSGQNNSSEKQTESKYGKDSVQCMMNLSLYREFVKQKSFVEALPGWRKVYTDCPRSTKNIYIDGAKIYRYLIKQEKDETVKKKLVDTLMMIYDQRIQYFGQEGVNLARKSVDLYRYDRSRYAEAYDFANKSYEQLQDKTPAAAMLILFQTSLKKYRKKEEEKEQLINDFSKASAVMDKQYDQEQKQSKKDRIKKYQTAIEDFFAKSGAADCETLIGIYSPKFEANKENVVFLKQTLKILDKIGCTESDLFAKAAEALYKQEPSASAAYGLAKVFLKKQNYSKSAEYYKEAISHTDSATDVKADYYFELATIMGGKLGQNETARSYAYKALAIRPNWGEPYLLIGNLYAGSSKNCGEDEFHQKAVYWVAVDKFIKAKSVDPSCAEKANKYISKYSQYFPGKENAFFNNVKDGDSFTIGCWINETTKARFTH